MRGPPSARRGRPSAAPSLDGPAAATPDRLSTTSVVFLVAVFVHLPLSFNDAQTRSPGLCEIDDLDSLLVWRDRFWHVQIEHARGSAVNRSLANQLLYETVCMIRVYYQIES